MWYNKSTAERQKTTSVELSKRPREIVIASATATTGSGVPDRVKCGGFLCYNKSMKLPFDTTWNFLGLSTDTKPTDDIGVNSLFLELDTGNFYFFNGVFISTYKEKRGDDN